MSKHAVVMTFPSSKWDVYGFCLKGFIEHWPQEVKAYALVEEPSKIPLTEIPDNVEIVDFDYAVGDKVKACEERNKSKGILDMGTTGNISVQAAKFARKAYAQMWVLEKAEHEYIHYIDADLYTHNQYSMEIIEQLTSSNFLIGCTPRWWRRETSISEALETKKLSKGYTETGYMIWNTQHKNFYDWFNLYKECYDDDLIFEFDAWHDCIAFDYATLTCIEKHNASVVDLGYGVRSSHPLVSGPMGKWMDHMKGQRKFIGESKERVRVHGR